MTNRFNWIFLLTFLFASCGKEIQGSYTAMVEGKKVTFQFKEGNEVLVRGYFPVELTGSWVEEKNIWRAYDLDIF